MVFYATTIGFAGEEIGTGAAKWGIVDISSALFLYKFIGLIEFYEVGLIVVVSISSRINTTQKHVFIGTVGIKDMEIRRIFWKLLRISENTLIS